MPSQISTTPQYRLVEPWSDADGNRGVRHIDATEYVEDLKRLAAERDELLGKHQRALTALRKIARLDYRGPRPQEQQIAYRTLVDLDELRDNE